MFPKWPCRARTKGRRNDSRRQGEAARGQERPDRRHRQRAVDRLGLRRGVPRVGRGARCHLSQRQGEEIRRAAGARARGADRDAARRADASGRWRRCSSASTRTGAGSISSSTPSPSRPRTRCAGASSTCRRTGSCTTMEVSCWSFIRMAHLAEPLMKKGGTLFTMTLLRQPDGGENYNIMGVAKAALESAGALHCGRARSERHPGARHLARPARDARRLRHSRIRRPARQGQGEGARPQPRQHRGRRYAPLPSLPTTRPASSPARPSTSTAAITSSIEARPLHPIPIERGWQGSGGADWDPGDDYNPRSPVRAKLASADLETVWMNQTAIGLPPVPPTPTHWWRAKSMQRRERRRNCCAC